MSINIELEQDMSLQQLAAAQADGYSVMRSAHVGNARGYNLAVASVGIPMLLVDHNIASQHPDEAGDRNYLPGSVVTREAVTPLPLQSIGGLALQTQLEDGQHLDAFHVGNLRTAFPETPVFTNTDYVRAEETVAGEIVRIGLDVRPELFTRVVESDGKLRKAAGSFADLVQPYGVLQLNDDPRSNRGVLMPNELDILNNFIVEAMHSGRDTQFHLSGPDMQRYIKDRVMRATLDELYAAVRSQTSFGNKLPEDLTVKLVPADQARFVSSRQRIVQLLSIFDWLMYEERVAEERRDFFTSEASQDAAARAEFMQQITPKTTLIAASLGEAVMDASEVFVAPKDAPFVSQYDALAEGLYMPAQNTHMTMRELRALNKRLDKIRAAQT